MAHRRCGECSNANRPSVATYVMFQECAICHRTFHGPLEHRTRYGGVCPSCTRNEVMFQHLDFLRRLHPATWEERLEALQLVNDDQRDRADDLFYFAEEVGSAPVSLSMKVSVGCAWLGLSLAGGFLVWCSALLFWSIWS